MFTNVDTSIPSSNSLYSGHQTNYADPNDPVYKVYLDLGLRATSRN